jgi:Sulfatase
MVAETDQHAPGLVRDNTHVDAPGSFATGCHLTADLVNEAILMIADHTADATSTPWLAWMALGACQAPHQAPAELIRDHDTAFAHGWDVEREQRLARQRALGLVPQDTRLPPRNDGVAPWDSLGADERRVFTRLQAASAAMLDHADQHIGWLEHVVQLDNTLVRVLSDNGAGQEGGPLGRVNAMRPYNVKPEPMAEKRKCNDDIGGSDTHSNVPQGWAVASNTPLRRYKQNPHGGGIRDPLDISWPRGIAVRGEVRPQFCHAVDAVPTLLDMLKVQPPAAVQGVPQMPIEGESFAASLHDAAAPQAAVLRDVWPPWPLARGLEGGGLPPVRHALRRRPLGAVSSGPRLLGVRGPGRAAARAREGAGRAVLAHAGGAAGAGAAACADACDGAGLAPGHAADRWPGRGQHQVAGRLQRLRLVGAGWRSAATAPAPFRRCTRRLSNSPVSSSAFR